MTGHLHVQEMSTWPEELSISRVRPAPNDPIQRLKDGRDTVPKCSPELRRGCLATKQSLHSAVLASPTYKVYTRVQMLF